MVRPRHWIVEVYKGRSLKRGFIIQKFEDLSFYLTPLGIKDDVIEGTKIALVKQAETLGAFPNVILFLNDEDDIMGMEDFIESWKRTK